MDAIGNGEERPLMIKDRPVNIAHELINKRASPEIVKRLLSDAAPIFS